MVNMRKLYMGLLDSGYVNNETLTKNEKKVLYGITRYPSVTDSELADIIDVKLSTLTSIKRRLADNGYYRTLMIPLVNRLGCELLAVIYMQFNPVIPLRERVETTKKTIEVFDEIFFSVGEEEKGFSMSLSQNYTNIGRINEIRTETFGRLGLLEKEYPHEVIFPFETSHIHRFFDFGPILKQLFTIEDDRKKHSSKDLFSNVTLMDFTTKEKKVYNALVEHPTATTQQIGEHVGLSRHTVARMKNQFFESGLLQLLTLPNMQKLGLDILTFYHISFNPNKAPSTTELAALDSPYTVFFASRKFESVLLSAYSTYQEYKADEMNKIRYLKENNLFSLPPFISTYRFEHMALIKEFDFAPLVRKTLGLAQEEKHAFKNKK
jgi:DNA-binding MarR family transcriptional regulator